MVDGDQHEFERLRASLVAALEQARSMREPARLVAGMHDFVAHMEGCYAEAMRFVDGAGDDDQRADLLVLFDEVRREWQSVARIVEPRVTNAPTKVWAERRRARQIRRVAQSPRRH